MKNLRSLVLGLAALAVLAAAAPQAPADGIEGKWNLTWDTEGGVRRTVWDISRDGEKITVKTDGVVLEGAFRDGRLTVEGAYYSAEAGYSSTLKVSAALENGELKGSGSWDQYAMTFSGKRAAPETRGP